MDENCGFLVTLYLNYDICIQLKLIGLKCFKKHLDFVQKNIFASRNDFFLYD